MDDENATQDECDVAPVGSRGIVLPTEYRNMARKFVNVVGVRQASKALSVDRSTLCRLLAGFPGYRSTIELLCMRLPGVSASVESK